MAKWTGHLLDDVVATDRHPAGRDTTGDATFRLLSPAGYSLWMVHIRLADGAGLNWATPRSDDVVYVLDGEVEIDGRTCEAGGAAIVERSATTELRARGPAEIAHFGSDDPAPPIDGPLGAPDGPGTAVHVYGPDGAFISGDREGVHAVWFADGTCPTCRVQLLEVTSPPTDEPHGKPHTHSADEIIYLLDGTVKLGSFAYGPGSALSIPGDVRYSLVGDRDGHRFINFRRDVSWQVYGRDGEPLLETAIARGGRATGDVR
ncbi:MAG: hypothetical protein WD225_07675 [Ilumatobacteraceae bacterium]